VQHSLRGCILLYYTVPEAAAANRGPESAGNRGLAELQAELEASMHLHLRHDISLVLQMCQLYVSSSRTPWTACSLLLPDGQQKAHDNLQHCCYEC
jgi:hypothetical protein